MFGDLVPRNDKDKDKDGDEDEDEDKSVHRTEE